ncbi:unnamed protein product, partial [Prorocentrum cordatum]
FWRRQGRQGRQGQVVRQGRQGQVLRQGRQVVRQGRQGQVLRQGRQVVRQGRQGQVRQGWQGQVFRQGQQVLRQGRQVWQRRRQVVSGLPLLWLPRPRAARDRRQPAPLRGSSPPARRVRQADAGAALLPPSGTPTAGRRLPTGRPAAPTRLPSGPPPRGSGTAGAGPGSHQQSVQALRGWADAGARDSSSSCHGHILVCVKSCGRAVIGRALCLLYAGCRPSCHYIGPARTCLCSLRCCTGTRWCNCKPKVVNLLCPPLPF